jgi:hypothetical protein
MRAREWLIASRYRCPAEYGIPPLPVWTQYRDEAGRLTLCASEDDEPFISAANPVKVRR